MAHDLDSMLGKFDDQDLTIRLTKAVFRVLPSGPETPPWRSIEEAVLAQDPSASPAVVARARALAAQEAAQSVASLAETLDRGAALGSLITGLGTAIRIRKARKAQVSDLLGMEERQATDAVTKALALAAITSRLFPGTAADRSAGLQDRVGGRALVAWFAAMEIALPFGEEAWFKQGDILAHITPDRLEDAASRLGRSMGPEAVAEARRIVPLLTKELDAQASVMHDRVDDLVDAVVAHIPGLHHMVELAGDVVSMGADALPVYRLLVPRLVAEICARRALDERDGILPVGPLFEPLAPEVEVAPPEPAPPEVEVATPKPAAPEAEAALPEVELLSVATATAAEGATVAASAIPPTHTADESAAWEMLVETDTTPMAVSSAEPLPPPPPRHVAPQPPLPRPPPIPSDSHEPLPPPPKYTPPTPPVSSVTPATPRPTPPTPPVSSVTPATPRPTPPTPPVSSVTPATPRPKPPTPPVSSVTPATPRPTQPVREAQVLEPTRTRLTPAAAPQRADILAEAPASSKKGLRCLGTLVVGALVLGLAGVILAVLAAVGIVVAQRMGYNLPFTLPNLGF